MITAQDAATRALTNEAKRLDKISRTSRNPAELLACAKRAAEMSSEARRLQGYAVGEVSRLTRELQAAFPGFHLACFPEWRAAIAERLEELRAEGEGI